MDQSIFLSDSGKKSTIPKVNCVSVLSDRLYGSIFAKIKYKTMVVGHRFNPSRKQEDQKFKISLSRPGLPEILA